MDRNSKEGLVAELAGQLSSAKAAFVADYRGLNVEKVTQLRRDLRNSGAEYRVVKNTLLRLAAKGTSIECMTGLLEGPTAVAIISQEPVAPAKVMADFAKANAKFFALKGGALGGKVLSADDVRALAELPSREVLIAKMLGSFNAPATNFVGVLAAIPGSFVRVLAAIQEKKAA